MTHPRSAWPVNPLPSDGRHIVGLEIAPLKNAEKNRARDERSIDRMSHWSEEH